MIRKGNLKLFSVVACGRPFCILTNKKAEGMNSSGHDYSKVFPDLSDKEF